MTVSISFDWHSYRYFPYEHRLARREVEVLLGASPEGNGDGLNAAVSKLPSSDLLSRLTYFREIRVNGSPPLYPVQARLEASASTKATDGLFREDGMPPLRRQSTRYSAHGLHEYRGKFHPHIVRAIGNLLGVSPGAWIVDPFCGSGTALLEGAHLGWNAVGVDRNPLGVFISNTKLGALRVDVEVLRSQVQQLVRDLADVSATLDFDEAFPPAARRKLEAVPGLQPLQNLEYLQQWFSLSVIEQLTAISGIISRVPSAYVRDIARVVLSDCLRAVSLQDPGDLRIRRRKDARDNYPGIPMFVEALTARVANILRAREVLPGRRAVQEAVVGDSRQGVPEGTPRPAHPCMFDGVITSPPYATALPYIDTQRLSLAFLGLADPPGIRQLEAALIGAREITGRERREEEAALAKEQSVLPVAVSKLCRRAASLAASPQDGFRRKNVPALLFRYFRDMRDVFESMQRTVRPGGFFAALVGPNKTTLGGEPIQIDTPELLAQVAESVGWTRCEIVPLDAYQRFDLHRSNSITTEALVLLKRGPAAKTRHTTSRRSPRSRPPGV